MEEEEEEDEEVEAFKGGLLEEVEKIGAKLTSALETMKDDSKKVFFFIFFGQKIGVKLTSALETMKERMTARRLSFSI